MQLSLKPVIIKIETKKTNADIVIENKDFKLGQHLSIQ